jgi:tetratricopeptide (TPR) repeat protein
MLRILLLVTAASCFVTRPQLCHAQNAPIERMNIVQDGMPLATIVMSENPPRATRLAAQELQTYVEKISGARFEIGTEPDSRFPVSIFVGQSAHAEKLGITSEGLTDGAYRITSGENWLALIGDDSNFTPIEPWPRGNSDIASGRMQAEWDRITGEHWGYTHSQLHKHYSGANSLFGTPTEQKLDKDGNVNVWTYDERGSFNAVCGFLRDLGVRWYMPGDIGEIVPRLTTIDLPTIDQTVRPDFPMRILNFRPSVYGRDVMMWGFRLGLRQPYGRQAAHGLHRMTHNEHYLKNKPEWFALYGGKRHTEVGTRLNQLCYSNEDLFREAVRFAQAQFDHFDMDVVSIMPPDGYTAICQCELCKGKDDPDRGSRGSLSNYVWDFVNRVAKEIGKSHPDKLISNCAYGVYTDPPTNIDKLEPNVQVIIVGGRRPTRDTPEEREELRQLRAGWTKKTQRPIEFFENYPFTGRNFYLPAYIPKVMGESINETKGLSRGEDIWLTMDFGENAVGYNHFLAYFTARMYWGGTSQDAVRLFDEYCERFYAPASDEMKAFFSYCEANWRQMESDGETASRALELFAVAKATAPADSVFAQRIKLIDNYLNGLRRKSVQLAQKRGPVSRLRLVGGDPLEPIIIDGNLNDKAWREIATASTGTMRELQTGKLPTYGTSIMAAWQKGSVHFAVRCEEKPGDKPNISSTRNGDQAIWYGDVVEFLINTDSHNYYQIAVNPAGALINVDRATEKATWFSWDSKAEVATRVEDDHWTVEIRIPVTDDENDPLHQVIGRKPTQSLPWYLNVCRQRVRGKHVELSAFSPTGTKAFHEPMKFAHFYRGQSHQFDADESVTDFVIATGKADRLLRARKFEDALSAYVDASIGKEVTSLQKSEALYQAAHCARALKDSDRASELASQIPLEFVAKTTQMENLLDLRQWTAIVEQFGNEDFDDWPFWQVAAGARARGRAYHALNEGEKAEADLQRAIELTADSRTRLSIGRIFGENYETVLKDDEVALVAYRQMIKLAGSNNGSAEYFYCIQGAARILTRQRKFDEALDVLSLTPAERLSGTWRPSMQLSRAEVLTAASRLEPALKAIQAVIDDPDATKSHRSRAADLKIEVTK